MLVVHGRNYPLYLSKDIRAKFSPIICLPDKQTNIQIFAQLSHPFSVWLTNNCAAFSSSFSQTDKCLRSFIQHSSGRQIIFAQLSHPPVFVRQTNDVMCINTRCEILPDSVNHNKRLYSRFNHLFSARAVPR